MTEPEEILESGLVAALSAAVPALDVIGALAPCEQGDMKTANHSHVAVFADVAGQPYDFQEADNMPFTYSVRVSLRVALADDASGTLFRDSARAVRSTLRSFLGDGCAALSADGFECDAFTLDGTSTELQDESGCIVHVKTYNATATGRYTPPALQEAAQGE